MATVSFDDLLTRAAENPMALARLAGLLSRMGDKARAREVAMKALRAAPRDAEVKSRVADILSEGVPDWHFRIVQDAARNAAFEAALRRAVTAETSVLEIGTGTGIIAMMAARAGARHVVTCEMVPAIAAAAQEIVTANGFADRVRVIAKKSYDIDPDPDMGGLADVMVSELVHNRMIGQDIFSVVEHAARVLLKPGAKIIPARGIVRVALAHDTEFYRAHMGAVDGFNLSAFDRFGRNSYKIRRGDVRLTLLSAPVDLFDFDFQSGGPFPAATASKVVISTGGTANGIAQWIALQMDEEGWYENAPGAGMRSAWAVIFWPFIEPHDHRVGTTVEVWGSHDRYKLRIWADDNPKRTRSG